MVETVSSKEFLNIQATIECRFSLKRARDLIRTDGKVVKKTKFNTLNTNVNNLEKILDTFTLIQAYQYNTNKI